MLSSRFWHFGAESKVLKLTLDVGSYTWLLRGIGIGSFLTFVVFPFSLYKKFLTKILSFFNRAKTSVNNTKLNQATAKKRRM